MVRYKRYRKYRNSTRTIRMKFQSFMDIHTTADDMQIISVSAGGKELLERLPGFFSTYKYYKIGNISVKLVPASTLPVDPTGLSLSVDDPGVDPRDQLTPGMMRITNGEDIFEDLTGLTAEQQHQIYNAMMLDPRWFKWMLQSGVKRHAIPRYWQIGQLHQDKWPGASMNFPDYNGTKGEANESIDGTACIQIYRNSGTGGSNVRGNVMPGISAPEGFFQTGHRGVLGWLPTDGFEYGQAFLTSPPEIEVMKIILPPAYKTEYYYRMYISQTVYFKDPIVMALGISDEFGGRRPLDVFHYAPVSVPAVPSTSGSDVVPDAWTGGNYGDH